MADLEPDDAPDEVPNWYLYTQNRAIQQKQVMIMALHGVVLTFVPAVVSAANPGSEMPIGVLLVGLLGLLIAVISMLKLHARDPDGYSRRVCDRIGINTWVDAEAKIAERNARTDGGEDR